MWHEARRQERKIRGMLVDYRRRAERRRDFYEKIKADPTQFLQLHGRPCKIHLDQAIATAADSPVTMMPWQGQADNLIDRFDVRAHLDFIPPIKNNEEEEESYEERQCNYERYRILAQNNFLSINEEKFLKQLHLEEQFGYTAETDKEKKRKQGAAIGFNYDDPGPGKDLIKPEKDSSDEDDSDSDLDVDLCIDVSKIEQSQAHEMNKCGQHFGMCSNDFYSFLINDMEEAENIRIAREEEHEKALFSGRKSRRERRAHREKRLANRIPSPPSYAARASPTYPAFRESKSRSKSLSPVNAGQITYITSFGGDEEPAPSTSTKPTYADKVKFGKDRKLSERDRRIKRSVDSKYRKRTRSRSPYRYKPRQSRSKSLDRRRLDCRRSDVRRSRSRSRNRRRYTRSRSHSRSRRNHRSPSTSSSCSVSSKSSSSSSTKSVSSVSSKDESKKVEPPKAPIQRYYGRRQEDKSSSELEGSSEEEIKPPATSPASNEKMTVFGNSGSTSKITAFSIKMTPQERLKKKMQILLNKQYKADKIAEQIRSEKAQLEQRNREDELREMALKLRKKQRERRHAYDDNNSRSSESDSSEDSSKATCENRKRSLSPTSPRKSWSNRDDDKYKDDERSKYKDEERPKYNQEERPKYKDEDRPKYKEEERPKCKDDERSKYKEEDKSKYNDERLKYKVEERSKFKDDERSKYKDEERSKYNGERPKYKADERLKVKDDERFRYKEEERFKYNEERPKYKDEERPKYKDDERFSFKNRSPKRTRTEYRSSHRNSPPNVQEPDRKRERYDDKKFSNKHRLVDY